MESFREDAIAGLEAQLNDIEAQGVSSSWVGLNGGKQYLYWMEGKRLRSERIRGCEVDEAIARWKRYVACEWLRGRIAEMHRAEPKRSRKGALTSVKQ